jgi:hypothetical protein
VETGLDNELTSFARMAPSMPLRESVSTPCALAPLRLQCWVTCRVVKKGNEGQQSASKRLQWEELEYQRKWPTASCSSRAAVVVSLRRQLWLRTGGSGTNNPAVKAIGFRAVYFQRSLDLTRPPDPQESIHTKKGSTYSR